MRSSTTALGIAGVKGFGGGFDRAMLQAFGEPGIKAFVQEAVNEGLKLEAALAQLDIEKRIVLMHYAPIAGTVAGEDPGIHAFLGTTRLLSPCESFGARRCSTATRTTAACRGRRPRGSRSTTWPCRCSGKHFDDRRFRVLEICQWRSGGGPAAFRTRSRISSIPTDFGM